MGYDRNDCYMTCGERDDRCAALGIEDPFAEIERLRAALMRAHTILIGLKVSPTGKDARARAVDEIDRILGIQQGQSDK